MLAQDQCHWAAYPNPHLGVLESVCPSACVRTFYLVSSKAKKECLTPHPRKSLMRTQLPTKQSTFSGENTKQGEGAIAFLN